MDQGDQRQPGLLRAVRARPGQLDPAQRRRPRARARRRESSTRRCSTHEKEGELLRALAEFPRVVAAARPAARAAPGRALPRGHRGVLPPLLRQLPGPARWATRSRPTCTARGCCWSPPPAPCSPTASRLLGVTRPGADVDVDDPRSGLGARTRRPARSGVAARQPGDPNALVPHLWSSTAHKNDAGELTVGGVAIPELVAEVNTPAYVLDEADFRARARAFRDGFADYDVFYAGKAFLCTEVARWIAEEGLNLDVCSDRRADRGAARRLRPGPDRLPRQQQDPRRAAPRGRRGRRPDHRRLVRRDRAARRRSPPSSAPHRAGHGAGDRRRRGAHPRVHRHRARGPEVRALDHLRRRAGRRYAACRPPRASSCSACTRHIGSQIFDSSGFEVAARRVLALHARICAELGVDAARARPRRRLRHRLHDPGRPERPRAARHGDHQDRRARVPGARRSTQPRLSIEPGRAIVGPSTCTVYTVGTVKPVALDGGAVRTYVSVDGGMSDNIRTALYDADYSCTLASPRLGRRAGAVPGGRQALRGRRHRGQRRVPARRRRARATWSRCPGTGAYCRSMASNYNHALRPPVVAVRDGVARVLVRRETEDDLLATDMGAAGGAQ